MRRYSFLFACLILMALMCVGQGDPRPFFNALITVRAGTTATHGAEFTSTPISIPTGCSDRLALLGLMFTRTSGSADTIDFYFQVSADNGKSWKSLNDPIGSFDHFSLATNRSLDRGPAVRVTRIIRLDGGVRVRLYRIVNNDKANDMTAVSATLLY